jgi:hypothetical protein
MTTQTARTSETARDDAPAAAALGISGNARLPHGDRPGHPQTDDVTPIRWKIEDAIGRTKA